MNPGVVLAVLGAGAVGAALRFAASRFLRTRSGLPVAVLVVNVVGSAMGGAILALSASAGLSGDVRLVLLTGFCGGLTTFSTFSVETIQLVTTGRARVAAVSVLANLVLGIGAAALAYLVVSR